METKELIEKLEGIITHDDYADDIRCQAVARLRDLHAAQQWRPIEEAEKDGSLHLVYCPRMGRRVAYWDRVVWVTDAGVEISPTRFKPMPLPPAPQGGEG